MMNDTLLIPPNAQHHLFAVNILFWLRWARVGWVNIRCSTLMVLIVHQVLIASNNSVQKTMFFVLGKMIIAYCDSCCELFGRQLIWNPFSKLSNLSHRMQMSGNGCSVDI